MGRYLDNFLGGIAFGMFANNPFTSGMLFMNSGYANRVDFGTFANPFPSVFGSGFYSAQNIEISPTTFLNPTFPTIDFSEVSLFFRDTFINPDSEYNKKMREVYEAYQKQYNESDSSKQNISPQFPFSSFYMPFNSVMNPYINSLFSNNIPEKKKTSDTDDNKTDKTETSRSSANRYNDKRFNKFLSIILDREGGYSDSKNDRGGKTYKGVTHTTYDEYRRSKGLPTRNVTEMTNDEMQEIYYENYYKASGADKISDKKLALYVFDTAVNMGVKQAKEFLEACNGDRSKFETLRKNRYKRIIENDDTQKANKDGWNNRMTAIKHAAENELNAIA